MALTYTPDAQLGSPCPDFDLPTVDGQTLRRDSLAGFKTTLVMFICNHCPYVQAIEDRVVETYKELNGKGVQFVGICSNDATEYPEDSFENLKKRWQEKEYQFPYLYDEDQSVAKTFGAVCTPDFFLYDENLKLVYRGRWDDSWKDASKVTRQEMKEAIENTLSGLSPLTDQVPSMGCNIKWKE